MTPKLSGKWCHIRGPPVVMIDEKRVDESVAGRLDPMENIRHISRSAREAIC